MRFTRMRSGFRYRRTRLFVMTLGYSRKSVRLLVFREDIAEVAVLVLGLLPVLLLCVPRNASNGSGLS